MKDMARKIEISRRRENEKVGNSEIVTRYSIWKKLEQVNQETIKHNITLEWKCNADIHVGNDKLMIYCKIVNQGRWWVLT